MARLDRALFDITQTNRAIDELLATTTKPRHRYLLQTYYRHRYLEIAGRYEEIFAPEMTVPVPLYNFRYSGIAARLVGDEVKGLYSYWAQTHQAVFYIEKEQVAVADNFVASVSSMYQQIQGKELAKRGLKPDDENAYYLYKTRTEMIWPYDDQGRMVGEDVWETQPEEAKVIKLDPADVLRTEEAGRLLAPFIKPLPSFDTVLRSEKTAA